MFLDFLKSIFNLFCGQPEDKPQQNHQQTQWQQPQQQQPQHKPPQQHSAISHRPQHQVCCTHNSSLSLFLIITTLGPQPAQPEQWVLYVYKSACKWRGWSHGRMFWEKSPGLCAKGWRISQGVVKSGKGSPTENGTAEPGSKRLDFHRFVISLDSPLLPIYNFFGLHQENNKVRRWSSLSTLQVLITFAG